MPPVHLLRDRRRAGFTLLELLVGIGLASLLVTALMSVAVMLGKQSAHVSTAPGDELERTAAQIADAVRYAWLVQQPATDAVVSIDPWGAATTFELEADGDLVVRRPDGRTGVLLDRVEAFDVSVETMSRLREAEPADVWGTWLAAPEPAGEAQVVVVEEGLPLGLGFTLSSVAPLEQQSLEDLPEQTLVGSLETLSLALAYLPDVGDPPADEDADEDDGNGNGKDKGKDKGKGKGLGGLVDDLLGGDDDDGGGDGKVTICHVPPGNPSNAHTISVGAAAVVAHLAHGDSLGACGSEPEPDEEAATVTLSLFDARSPDDGRPHGSALASITLPAASLPAGAFTWTLVSGGGDDDGGDDGGDDGDDDGGKVTICHIPPGNPSNAHTIRVGAAAVPAHLAHGDVLGSCDRGEVAEDVWAVSITPPSADVSLDVAGLGLPIEPAHAYTLVLELSGPGSLLLRGVPTPSPYDSAVAQKSWEGGAFEPLPLGIARAHAGMRRVTQTEEHRLPSLVRLSLEHEDGRFIATSTTVANQAAIANRWYGTAPGELPELFIVED